MIRALITAAASALIMVSLSHGADLSWRDRLIVRPAPTGAIPQRHIPAPRRVVRNAPVPQEPARLPRPRPAENAEPPVDHTRQMGDNLTEPTITVVETKPVDIDAEPKWQTYVKIAGMIGFAIGLVGIIAGLVLRRKR